MSPPNKSVTMSANVRAFAEGVMGQIDLVP
jgi:hypothetical protein